MAINLANKTRVTAPAAPYPFGNIKDTTPSDKGTPVNVETYGDFHQFFAKMAFESGITLNDLPENDTNTWQYFQAMLNVMNSSVGKAFVLSQIGTYTPNNLVILYGCEITHTIPGLSSITAGAIYYNDYIYYVPSGFVTTLIGDTLVYKINETVNPKFIYLDGDITGTGIADWDQSSVIRLNVFTTTILDVFTSTTDPGVGVSSMVMNSVQASSSGRIMTLNCTATINFLANSGGGGTSNQLTLQPNFIPKSLYSKKHPILATQSVGGAFYRLFDGSITLIGSNILRIETTDGASGGVYPRISIVNFSISYRF